MLSAAIVITTYNWPQALDLVLSSVLIQTVPPREIHIADDGSTESTRELTRKWQDALPVPLFHHWHEDRGFRPNPVRNEAVANTDSDIIIMLDGDMIMHPQFVADHIHFSREGQFIQSRRVRLSEPLTTTALRARQYRFSFFTPGVTRRTQAIRNRGLSGMVSTRSRSMQHIRGANMSMWRKDFVAVNGMNEDFIGWGFEDHDLTARLYQLGLDRLYLRHAALAYHLEHADNNRDRKSINQEIFEQNCRDRVVRVSNGLVENHRLKVAAAKRRSDYLLLIQARLHGQHDDGADETKCCGLPTDQVRDLMNGKIDRFSLSELIAIARKIGVTAKV